MLTIAVCVKQVVDPEAPLSLFEIAPDGKNLVPPPGTPPVLSAFDENALEAALRIKDAAGARIVVLSLGNKHATEMPRAVSRAGLP
jgi:electron transfer flavoprotein beta subunit